MPTRSIRRSHRFEVNGGEGAFQIVTGANCPWTVESNVTWLKPVAQANGSGPVTYKFSVARNTTSSRRGGTLTIGGQTVTVEQAGIGGTCDLTPIQSGTDRHGAFDDGRLRNNV
ncbi:MAG: BACON domain-containing protein [Blastocatellia bacterium]